MQERCLGGFVTVCCSAAVLDAGVQPRRTAGENELPKDQQRHQNSKAGLRHALRATERMRTSGPTSEGDCSKNPPYVNRWPLSWPLNGVPRVPSRISAPCTNKPAIAGFPIFCGERLQAVKWRNWKILFMRQDTMFEPPVRNPVPTIYNLFRDPREETPTADSCVVGPMLKIVWAYEVSVMDHPIIKWARPILTLRQSNSIACECECQTQ